MIDESFEIERENNIKIYCYYFLPEDRKSIKGIVQIVHGFGEHAMRYKEFASVLVNNGYAVCTLDNRGHGKSATKNQNQKLGHIADANGANLILEDMYALMEKAKSDLGSSLNYILFGHSFGSFLVRAFAIRYPQDVNALILSATKGSKNASDHFAHLIANVQKGLFGSRASSFFMHKMTTGGYSKKYFPEDCNNAAWLTTDKSEQLKFLEDEYCLKTPASIATYLEILNVLNEISDKKNINKMRKDLPILMLSGDCDVIGDFAHGINKLYQTYVELGLTNVVTKVYKGLRHELLNERDKLIVTNDIMEWLRDNTKNNLSLPNLDRGRNIFKDFLDTPNKDDEQKADENTEDVLETAKTTEDATPAPIESPSIDTTNMSVADEPKRIEPITSDSDTALDSTNVNSTEVSVDSVDIENTNADVEAKPEVEQNQNIEEKDPVVPSDFVDIENETTAKKPTAKKSASKKTTAKKATTKATKSAEKSSTKKATAKSEPKKTTAKKSTDKKLTDKKLTDKKLTDKKEAAKSDVAKKSVAKKTAAKASTKKTTAKAEPKKATAKKESAPKKASVKKTSTKKATATKKTTK